MARDPTRFSRVSIGYVDSAQTVVDVDAGDSGPIWSSIGGIDIGESGTGPLVQVSTTTHSDDLGTISAHDSSTITVEHSGATRGDTFLVALDSEWSGADYDITVTAQSGDTTDEVNIIAVNSTITNVDTTNLGVWRLTRINFGTYI